jgi:hypothetical protein
MCDLNVLQMTHGKVASINNKIIVNTFTQMCCCTVFYSCDGKLCEAALIRCLALMCCCAVFYSCDGKRCKAALIRCVGTNVLLHRVLQLWWETLWGSGNQLTWHSFLSSYSFLFLIFFIASQLLNGGVAVKMTVFQAMMPSSLRDMYQSVVGTCFHYLSLW